MFGFVKTTPPEQYSYNLSFDIFHFVYYFFINSTLIEYLIFTKYVLA